MKSFILIVALVCSIKAVTFDDTLNDSWMEFQKVFNKEYQTIDESLNRRSIWEANLKYISRHNLEYSLGKHSFTVAMNKYGDMTNEEFVRVMNRFNSSNVLSFKRENSQEYVVTSGIEIPDSVDWRAQGYVSPIKDQGQCGSCWAFTAVDSMEGQHFKKTGKLVSLSEQNLVDCSTKQGNQGCNGGLPDQAFAYVKANKGIDTETSYPYKATNQKCQFKAANIGATITGYIDIKSGDENAFTNAIALIGPISSAVDASQSSFQFYSNGIYSDPNCSSTQIDHGVTAVGYGSQGNSDYYIVRNMWGTSWGDKGYMLLARNKNNMCGFATMPSYPTV